MRTASDAEIDLIVERPGQPLLCIEIKSNSNISAIDISTLRKLSHDLTNCEAICLCNEKYSKKINHVMVWPWQQGLKQYFVVV